MKKLTDLRSYLLTSVAHLQANPDCLHTWIDKGKSFSNSNGSGYSFNSDYKINCLITDYAGEINKLLTPFNVWVVDNVLIRDKELIEFESETIDHDKSDVLISINIYGDSVIVNDEGDGFKQCDDIKQNINDAIGA